MNDRPPTPSRRLKAYAAVAKGALWLLMAAWLVLALAWGALHAWIVPRIGELRPALETEASQVLGVPVRIGRIEARSEGLVPSFELNDVLLLDPAGRAALRLPRVLATMSPRSLLRFGFQQLYIDRPELDIRRDATGRIFVAGLDFSRGGDTEGRGIDWLFSQTEFVIRNGRLRWTDEARAAPPLTLDGVDVVMRNGTRRHALRIDATPPPEWGDRFSVRGIFRQPLLSQRPGRWQDWEGQLYGELARVDVSQLRRYTDLGFEVSEGHGAVRAWADISHGQIAGGVVDLALGGVNARLAPRLAPLALQSISGRVGGQLLAGGFEVETRDLQFETQEGVRWPGGNVFLRWTDAHGLVPVRGEIRADKLDLFALGQIASRLPLDPDTHAALAAYAPRGLVETLSAKWEGPREQPLRYEARGRASRLEIASRPLPAASAAHGAHPGTPGIRGASVDFELTQAGGRGKLQVRKGAVDVPGVFEEPVIPLDELSADVQWKIDGQDISVAVNNLKLANADTQGEAQIRWHTGSGARRLPGVLDLQASVSRADGSRVWRYLPLDVPKSARDYVRDSVTAGVATGGRFRVKGDLHDFPFKDPRQGEFRVSAEVQGVNFAFVPRTLTRGATAWPALTGLGGELVFERQGMQVNGAKGRLAGAPGLAVQAEARIADFHHSVVAVSAQMRGPLAEALAVVNGSPVSPMINQALAKASGNGNAEVQLKLELPLAALDRSKVQGQVALAGNDIQITPDTPLLARARGTVSFSERGFTIAGGQARALGGEVRIEGGTRTPATGAKGAPDNGVQIRAQGTATAEGLRQARELGLVARLARDASGSAAYAVNLNFRRGLPEVAVTSNLQGLALNLPAPMGKSAEAALPLRFENALTRESLAPGASTLVDQLTVEVGRVASVVFVRDVTGADTRVLRGAIAVGLAPGETVTLPEQGVMANINLAHVNIDQWERVLGAAPAPAAPGTSGAPAAPSRSAAGSGAAAGYLPTQLAVRAQELVAQGRTLHNVVVGGARDGGLWRANVDAAELNGYVEYRQPGAGAAGRLYARLARASIAAGSAQQVESFLADEQPAALPGLDIVVDDFELRGKKLGKLEIDAVNRGGPGREWRLNKLNLTMPEAAFSATGNWAVANAMTARAIATPERMRTVLRFRLDVADSGQLLTRMGTKGVLRGGKGRMDGQIGWLGSPLSLNYATMDGAFNVNMESGQFLKADPGLAKLLGVLSLQSLPRRLTLDFRDVFSDGFAFDFVRGDVTIQDGIAATNNLQMKGVNAAVLMEGKADIGRETQDLRVLVVPEINAGTASLALTAINPAIGLGTFLAQMFLREPLARAATQEFHIDGTWADPRIARVNHRSNGTGTVEAQADKAKSGSN
ncbi:YhdP family protein [Ramlibacter solisilvae]|uniref:YhdP family protein n=1 Tax=Ramlibacter tataouinensis TaxID=94132 RepID=UPI000776B4E5|nr:YhdP family protein [Ramlibacter tataouinensis]